MVLTQPSQSDATWVRRSSDRHASTNSETAPQTSSETAPQVSGSGPRARESDPADRVGGRGVPGALQRAARHLGRLDDSVLDPVDVLAGRGVKAVAHGALDAALALVEFYLSRGA